jgi:lantibiotic modifying enzyme
MLKTKSYEILYDTLIRKDEKETMIKDCCLCHGTSGVAIMYDMLYKKTKNEKFKETAYYWYEKTIMEPYEHEYAGGYKIHKGTSHNYISDISFLSGISGIGLSLMASIRPVYPEWIEFLLLK